MGSYQTDGVAGPTWRSATKHKHARGDQCDFLHRIDRLTMACTAKRLPSYVYCAVVFLCLDEHGCAEMNDLMVAAERVLEGRNAEPTGCIIDSQSIKIIEGEGPCGYDASKKIKGRKHYITMDTLGNLLKLNVHSASIQDRDGAPDLFKTDDKKFPTLHFIFDDGGYGSDKLKEEMGD